MIACPVCEHQQVNGFECEVCGKDLSGALGSLGAPPVPIAPVEGLEVTVPERVGDVPIERAPDVELTAAAPVANVPAEVVPDLEMTGRPPVGDVAAAPMAEKEQDRAPDDGVRTQLPTGAVMCRYCRNVQASGAVCDKCGMRLPRPSAAAIAAAQAKANPAAATKKKAIEDLVRCKSCGAPGHAGQRCGECGRQIPVPE